MTQTQKVPLPHHSLQYGTVVATWTLEPIKMELRKVVDHVAYARNGNHHNPTVYYRWELWLPNGTRWDSFTNKRTAMDSLSGFLE